MVAMKTKSMKIQSVPIIYEKWSRDMCVLCFRRFLSTRWVSIDSVLRVDYRYVKIIVVADTHEKL